MIVLLFLNTTLPLKIFREASTLLPEAHFANSALLPNEPWHHYEVSVPIMNVFFTGF